MTNSEHPAFSLREAVEVLARFSADDLAKAGGGGISFHSARASKDNGETTDIAVMVSIGNDHTALIQRHMPAITEEARKAGLVDSQRDRTEEVQEAIDKMVPKEDARGCRDHSKFNECVADWKEFVRNCWPELYSDLAKLGADFTNIKDPKEMRHAIRSSLTAAVFLGMELGKSGCRGYLGSKYKP